MQEPQETEVLFLGWEDLLEVRMTTPLQYSCLENPMDGGAWRATVHGVAKSQTRLSDFIFTSHFHALEEEMATHSSIVAWIIPWTEKPDGLKCVGSQRVRHTEHACADRQTDSNLEAARSRPWAKQSRQRPERRGLAVSEDLRGCHRSWVPAGREQIMKDKGFPAAAA